MEFKDVRFKKRVMPEELGGVALPIIKRGSVDYYSACAAQAATNIWAEFGVQRGRTARLIMKSLPADGEMHLFDSFYGLPEPWHLNVDGSGVHRKGLFSTNGEVPDMHDDRAVIHKGLFAESLPVEFKDQLGLVHFDCDLYSSTRDALRGILNWIGKGTVLVFDELIEDPNGRTNTNWREHEYKALAETGLDVEWIGHDGSFGVAGVVK